MLNRAARVHTLSWDYRRRVPQEEENSSRGIGIIDQTQKV